MDRAWRPMPGLSFETRRLEQPNLFFTFTTPDRQGHPVAGKWEAAFPSAPRPFTFDLTVSGGIVSGVITAGGGATVIRVLEGTADQRSVMFKVNSPEGARTITFTGTLDGDRLSFERDVLVPPGGDPGGAALWGVGGARTFTARRAPDK